MISWLSRAFGELFTHRTPCFHSNQEEVRVIDELWFGTDEKVGWLRCKDCGHCTSTPRIVGDGQIRKEPWD